LFGGDMILRFKIRGVSYNVKVYVILYAVGVSLEGETSNNFQAVM
jgi:hypothetical protein